MSQHVREFGAAVRAFEASLSAGSTTLRRAAASLEEFAGATGKWEARQGALAALDFDGTMIHVPNTRASSNGLQESARGVMRSEEELVGLNASVRGLRDSCSTMLRVACDAREFMTNDYKSIDDLKYAHDALLMSQCAAMFQRELALKEEIVNAISLDSSAVEFGAFECAWKRLAYVNPRQLVCLKEHVKAM